MAKQIVDRYASAHEMLEALELIPPPGSSPVSLPARVVSRIVVLPFQGLRNDEQINFLALSLPDAINHSLLALDNLIVRSSFIAGKFGGSPDPKTVGAEADVDDFLTGSLNRSGDRFRLRCQLIGARSGTVIWSERADSSMEDLFTIQDELPHPSQFAISHEQTKL